MLYTCSGGNWDTKPCAWASIGFGTFFNPLNIANDWVAADIFLFAANAPNPRAPIPVIPLTQELLYQLYLLI